MVKSYQHTRLNSPGANMFMRAAPFKILESIGRYIQRPPGFDNAILQTNDIRNVSK